MTQSSREMGLLSDGELEDRTPRYDYQKPRSDIGSRDLIRNLSRGRPLLSSSNHNVNKTTTKEVAQLLNLLRSYRVDSTMAQDIYNQLLNIVDIDDFPAVE